MHSVHLYSTEHICVGAVKVTALCMAGCRCVVCVCAPLWGQEELTIFLVNQAESQSPPYLTTSNSSSVFGHRRELVPYVSKASTIKVVKTLQITARSIDITLHLLEII